MLIEHLLPAARDNPAEHVVEGWNADPVAGSTMTSVNDHAALPQLVTVALIVVFVPTARLPNVRTSVLIQNFPCAATLGATARLISNSKRLRIYGTTPRAAARLSRVHDGDRAAPQRFGKPRIATSVTRFGMRSGAIGRFRMRRAMRKWSRTVRRAIDDGVFFGRIDRVSAAGQRSNPVHFPLRRSPRRSGAMVGSYGCVPDLNISLGPKLV